MIDDILDKVTIGEKYDPAMKITDPEEAKEYFEKCVEHNMRISGNSRAEAEKNERSSLAYYAAYGSSEQMDRVNRLFNTTHPFFGDPGALSHEELFKIGGEWAENKGKIKDPPVGRHEVVSIEDPEEYADTVLRKEPEE